jgi:hypothetical protein
MLLASGFGSRSVYHTPVRKELQGSSYLCIDSSIRFTCSTAVSKLPSISTAAAAAAAAAGRVLPYVH